MDNTEQQIENLFIQLSPELEELTQQLRVFLKEETKPLVELIFSSYNSINIGYGFTEKAWDCYCGIIIYNKHINISFPSGASLEDPKQILQGKGTRVRHIKIHALKDIKQPSVVTLLNQARENAWIQTTNKNNQQNTLRTIIRSNSKNIK
jgi:hypothetical protein